MKKAFISGGGQIQIPAEIRRRWGTRSILIDDRGDSLLVRPLPDDPIGAAVGSLRPESPGPSTEQIRRSEREDEPERKPEGRTSRSRP